MRPKVPLLPKATQHMPHSPAPGPRAQVTDRRSFCAVEQRASTNHLVQTTREAGHHASSHSQGSSAENATASHTPAQQGELSLRLSHTLCV
ncbi:hypothetical protein J4Q44_G00091960 [Coregonus suidteri]|uniref:Uncharacterized protein n=1 Tax=Coregonus suidteri TaxID=861788 RepID=A0AAN8QYV8_9TELE